MDMGSALFSQVLANLTQGEATVLYCLATLKTVHDHSALDFSWDPLSYFPNGAKYHAFHHLLEGIKTNYSQPFFTFWDYYNHTDKDSVAKQKKLGSKGE